MEVVHLRKQSAVGKVLVFGWLRHLALWLLLILLRTTSLQCRDQGSDSRCASKSPGRHGLPQIKHPASWVGP